MVNIYVLIWSWNRSVSTEVSNCEMSWLSLPSMTFYIIDASELEGKVWGMVRGKLLRKVIFFLLGFFLPAADTCYIKGVCGV